MPQTMPSEIFLVLPHQLFHSHEAYDKRIPFLLFEEYLFFKQYGFHKKKIVLHRASMKQWQAEREREGFAVMYAESAGQDNHIASWLKQATEKGLRHIRFFDPADDWALQRITNGCRENNVSLQMIPSPHFLNTPEGAGKFFAGKNHYHQTDFYIYQRKKTGILLEESGKPAGGKWTYDSENRERLPAKTAIPTLKPCPPSEILSEAILYTDRFFPRNPGDTASFMYPVSRKDALKWMHKFLEERFANFGRYEDAMVAAETFLYHSVLTPMLNTGLLYPQEIIDAALHKWQEGTIPLNAAEGFVRQIIGWREFIHLVYRLQGRRQRTANYWGFTRKIPLSFYTGNTGIIPVDMVIKKLLKHAYNHHIERLMVLGNFFLLCEFDPDEVYRWFMEMYIDAYDWVMVPNVYGMTQFADGGLMTTKPYISGSNYLMKMGDWPKGAWQQVWDGLFWRFMHVHRDFFLQNPRLGMLVKTFDKMSEEKQKIHLENAESFLKKLDGWNKHEVRNPK